MGCAPSVNAKHKECVYSRNSTEFSAPEGQDEQVEENDVKVNDKGGSADRSSAPKRNNVCPTEANGNSGLAYLDASSAGDIYKRLQQVSLQFISEI